MIHKSKILKEKTDEYFGIEGCLESQIWFYGILGFFAVVSLFLLSIRLLNHNL
ncbi:hypothetical protein [Niallia taxi]|uniref:hypothetical protein n=1 Tax=Niallia taxi TaxID=2499688 RepID=UPI0015F37D46|nr:hypothetical protein [Niallia taxi]